MGYNKIWWNYRPDFWTTGTIGTEMRDIAKRMTSLVDQLQRKEAYYWQKFSAMEQSVSQMQAQGSWIASAFAK